MEGGAALAGVGGRGQAGAVGFMFLAALCYSLVPLLLLVSGGTVVPFLFNFFYRGGGVVGGVSCLLLFSRGMLFDPGVLRLVVSRLARWDLPLLLVPYLAYTFFSWSASLVPVAVTTVVFEVWPVLFVLVTERMVRREGRYLRSTPVVVLPVVLGFAGVCLVVVSGAGPGGLGSPGSLLGVGLAGLASVCAVLGGYNLRWALVLAVRLRPSGEERRLAEFFCLMVLFTVGSLFSCLVNLVGELVVPGVVGLGKGLLLLGPVAVVLAVLGGCLLDSGGTVFQRKGVLRAAHLGVASIAYSTPLFSLGWLWVVVGLAVAWPWALLAGAVLVVVSNLLAGLGSGGLVRVTGWFPGRGRGGVGGV